MMKKDNSPFYPAYCDELIEEFGVNMSSHANTLTPQVTIGWGWTEWGDWIDDSCPKECGRRCRVRARDKRVIEKRLHSFIIPYVGVVLDSSSQLRGPVFC